jgi:hypothetical protein
MREQTKRFWLGISSVPFVFLELDTYSWRFEVLDHLTSERIARNSGDSVGPISLAEQRRGNSLFEKKT